MRIRWPRIGRTSVNSPTTGCPPAQKLDFIHGLLGREMAEVRMFLERIERYSASLERHASGRRRRLPMRSNASRATSPRVPGIWTSRATPTSSRCAPGCWSWRADLGWLTPEEQRDEIMRMIGDQLARNAVSPAEVDQVCALNKDHELDLELDRLQLPDAQAGKVPQAAILACLGSAEGHARVLQALTSPNDDEAQIAQVYLRHRPIDDPERASCGRQRVSRA